VNKELLEEINKGNISRVALFTQDESPILYTEKYVKEKDKEIERLNKQTEEYQKALDETTSEKIELANIINEVREYIEKNWISQKDADNYRFDDAELIIEISDIADLFDILDKGKE
jgi:predicted  nucleic acid-binding Zn-ribbon protein